MTQLSVERQFKSKCIQDAFMECLREQDGSKLADWMANLEPSDYQFLYGCLGFLQTRSIESFRLVMYAMANDQRLHDRIIEFCKMSYLFSAVED